MWLLTLLRIVAYYLGMNTKHQTQEATIEIASIEASVAKNGGVLESYGYGFSVPSSKPARVGGWEIRLVDRRGMGNHGSYVAVAMEPETFRLQWNATKRFLHGLAESSEVSAGETFATKLLPVLGSTLYRSKGVYLFTVEGWAYFAHREENFIRVGWDTYRIWRHPARRKP